MTNSTNRNDWSVEDVEFAARAEVGVDVSVGYNGGYVPYSEIPSLVAWLQAVTDRELSRWAMEIQDRIDTDAEYDRLHVEHLESENSRLLAELAALKGEEATS